MKDFIFRGLILLPACRASMNGGMWRLGKPLAVNMTVCECMHAQLAWSSIPYQSGTRKDMTCLWQWSSVCRFDSQFDSQVRNGDPLARLQAQ